MSEKITFKELVELIAKQSDQSQSSANSFISELVDIIESGLKKDGEVSISGFGKFELRWMKERLGTNPQTGDKITIPGQNKVVFKPYKTLREGVNAPYSHLESKIIEEDKKSVKEVFIPPSRKPERHESIDELVFEREHPYRKTKVVSEEIPAPITPPLKPNPALVREVQDRGSFNWSFAAAGIIALLAFLLLFYMIQRIPDLDRESQGIMSQVEVPLNGDPATDDPLAEEPLTDESNSDEPVTVDSDAADPATGEPFAEEPVTIDSDAADPATDEPLAEEPVAVDSDAADPATDEPFAEEPLTNELAAVDSDTAEPRAEDPDAVGIDVELISPADPITGNNDVQTGFELNEYQMSPGESLWSLAETELGNPYLWPIIYHLNRDILDNPNAIPLATELEIPVISDPDNLNPFERDQVAMGYFDLYEWNRINNPGEARFFLWAVGVFSPDLLENPPIEVDPEDLSFAVNR